MRWDRRKSNLEELMVEILKKKKKPLTLLEVVDEISKTNPEVFTGKTPSKSLYSIIYRREKLRIEKGSQPMFLQITAQKARKETLYSLNPTAS